MHPQKKTKACRLLTDGNIKFDDKSQVTEQKEYYPKNSYPTQHVDQTFGEDELSIKLNQEDIQNKLKLLSDNLYRKGVIKDYNLVQAISDNLKAYHKKSPQRGDFSKKEHFEKNVRKSRLSLAEILSKENKRTNILIHNRPSTTTNKADLIFTEDKAKKEPQFTLNFVGNLKLSERKSKSPGKQTSKSLQRYGNTEKNLVQKMPKIENHVRNSSLQLVNFNAAEKNKKTDKNKLRGQYTPTLSPRAAQRSTRLPQERAMTPQNLSGLNSSDINQETKRKSSKKKEMLVQVKIRCYSPTKQDQNEKPNKEELLKTLRMVKKFIDKSLGNDAKLQKLALLLKHPDSPKS